MSWATSKKFRYGAAEMSKHLDRIEPRLRAAAEATCKVYTPEEIRAYAAERGLPVAPSVAEALAVLAPKSKKRPHVWNMPRASAMGVAARASKQASKRAAC
jgi:hypothetical protein